MERRQLFQLVFLLIAVLLWGCEPDYMNPHGGPPGGGNGGNNGGDGGGAETIYKLELLGSIGGVAYGPVTRDNKKTQVIEGSECEMTEYTGMSTLLENLPGVSAGCYSDCHLNVWGFGARAIDRRVDDVRVACRLFLSLDGVNVGWLNFFGSIDGGGNIIIPSGEDAITITMDNVESDTDIEGCAYYGGEPGSFSGVTLRITVAPDDWACPPLNCN